MKFKFTSKLAKLKLDKKKSDAYYKKDIPGIQEQAFYMLKSRVGIIIEGVVMDKELNLNISGNQPKGPENLKKLQDILTLIIDQMLHLTEMRETDNFDNPFVLSFLSNYILTDCFVPDSYLFKYEMDRIEFARTGYTR